MIGNRLQKRGITLIELLTGIGLFSVVIIAFLQLFTSAFREQGKVMSKVELLNSASYVSEYISRALRMARKDDSEGIDCLSMANANYELTYSGQGIKIRNHNNECQEFFLDNSQILKTSKGSVSQSLTPSNLKVESLRFNLSGDEDNDSSQPKVTFALKLKINEETINIQTTVSQRDLDVGE